MSDIYCELLACAKSNSPNSETYLPNLCTKSAEVYNSLNSQIRQNETNIFSLQDEEFLSMLQDLQENSSSDTNSSSKCICGYFWSATGFNLNLKLLTDTEINILEKGLHFGLIQNKINEPELRKDF